jgi:signal transduction histidine kinase
MPARMNEGARVLLYSAARELLMNVVKHAGTRKASLILRRVPGRVELEVTDRGRGMSATPATARPDHHPFGLFSIRERAELLGGTLTVDVTDSTFLVHCLDAQSAAAILSGELERRIAAALESEKEDA